MKLLTLEDIEKIEANLHLQEGFPCSQEDFGSLLDTARAYWELMAIYNDSPTLHKDKPQSVELAESLRKEFWEAVHKGQEEQMFGRPEDKPHAPTIKAVIEALGYIKHVDNSTGAELAIKSLEKHLE